MHRQIFRIALLILMLSAPISATANQLFEKTPKDIHHLILLLANETLSLQQEQGLSIPWPSVPAIQGEKGPRHEYQKALEVLSKINRYRVIHKMGPVSTPYYPSRQVTPNEVYDLVQRLVNELRELHRQPSASNTSRAAMPSPATVTRAMNYQHLWEISKAFDPLLGVRGFLPGDVFAQSQRVVDLVRFLRISQNIPSMPPKPEKPEGKHPNHALQAAYQLLGSIRTAEHNLWMDPVVVPHIEKRVITPTEVYDALQTTIAELQRIKFRLGIDRAFDDIAPDPSKTPDDVIQNLQWAARAMPLFPFDHPLVQYDPQSLEKTPNDVFAVASLILKKLRYYKRMRGIRTKANHPPEVMRLQPRHVYQKTLECLKKVVALRQQVGFAASAIPYFPMRNITPSDVFALASRLDRALELVYHTIHMPPHRFQIAMVEGKTPSDVFRVMWQISYELDTILGTQGQTPNDVFQMASLVVAHIHRLQHHLGYPTDTTVPPVIPGLKPKDVIAEAHALLKSIGQFKVRAGMFETNLPIAKQDAQVTPNDVFNLVSVIVAELTEIELHFGISTPLKTPPLAHDKTPSDVYQQLERSEQLLHAMLGHTDG